MIKYEGKYFISFKIDEFLYFTTTKKLVEQTSVIKDLPSLPLVSKEKTLSLYNFVLKCPDVFIDKSILMCEQIHGNKIINPVQSDLECISGNLKIDSLAIDYKIFLKTDGIISNNKGEIIAVFTADCIPLFVIDRKNKWFGLIHVGRKGLQMGIIENLIGMLNQHGASLNNTIFIAGPHICENCYIVNGEKFSLEKTLISKLESFGIKQEQFINSEFCTYHHNERFFSYRKNTTPFRLLSVITKTS
jgi:copper oxidase (laccase) domain-containing protein